MLHLTKQTGLQECLPNATSNSYGGYFRDLLEMGAVTFLCSSFLLDVDCSTVNFKEEYGLVNIPEIYSWLCYPCWSWRSYGLYEERQPYVPWGRWCIICSTVLCLHRTSKQAGFCLITWGWGIYNVTRINGLSFPKDEKGVSCWSCCSSFSWNDWWISTRDAQKSALETTVWFLLELRCELISL